MAAVSALAAGFVPRVHAGEDNTIQVALIGCGGRGSGAAVNALSVKGASMKVVALADVFENRLTVSYRALKEQFGDRVDVPEDRKFVGFDAGSKAMDCLRPGDVAIFATPPAFRWVHFAYAIQKGLNVFMEKPITVDGPTSKRMLALADEATAKNLKVGVGLMSRHSRALEDLAKRVHDGELGDIILQRGYRMHGPIGYFFSPPKPADANELLYQVQRFHSFLWASGGNYSDFYIHIIDHLGWMKNAWPVKAKALGGRHYRESPQGEPSVDQNFDTYSVEYTYADGAKFYFDGRCMNGCDEFYASYLHGTKGSAIASAHGDCGLPASIHKGQDFSRANLVWESKVPQGQESPYDNEWTDLVDAIRNDKPYNEARRGVEASLVTSMGRMAAHTGRVVTFDDMLNCPHEMAPGLDTLTVDSPAPLQAGPDGFYPKPKPGIVKDREY
ncbi:MAG: Gfo/Idh/MocA family oxidoreductase [Planctomycetes bacterium]|nr:Gfo/Idh/MocA family oxidoreductase [Planctomycetota bacterium]